MIKKILSSAFITFCRKFEGTYVTRFRPIGFVYTKLFYFFKPAKITLENVNGNRMFLNMADTTSMRMYMFKLDRPIIKIMENNLKPGSIFIDIGAHIGYFTLLAAKLVGSKGRVYAFEPEPKNHELLSKNVKENGYQNVSVIKKCVSSRCGLVDFFISKDSGTHSTKIATGKKTISESVTLDKFCRDRKISKIDLIKIDIEGGEINSFDGMKNVVKKSRSVKLIAEYVPSYIEKSGNTPKIFMDKLCDIGMRKFYLISDDRISMVKRDYIENLKDGVYNILAEK